MTLFAAAGSAGLWFLIVPIVDRPRPSPEMVHVAMDLPTGSFPSGHVLNLTAIFGFLIYLTIVLIADVRWRALLVALLVRPDPDHRRSPASTTARTGRATCWAAT